jgi:hypothetical protein
MVDCHGRYQRAKNYALAYGDRRGRVINYAQGTEPCTVKKSSGMLSHEDQEEQNGIRKEPP